MTRSRVVAEEGRRAGQSPGQGNRVARLDYADPALDPSAGKPAIGRTDRDPDDPAATAPARGDPGEEYEGGPSGRGACTGVDQEERHRAGAAGAIIADSAGAIDPGRPGGCPCFPRRRAKECVAQVHPLRPSREGCDPCPASFEAATSARLARAGEARDAPEAGQPVDRGVRLGAGDVAAGRKQSRDLRRVERTHDRTGREQPGDARRCAPGVEYHRPAGREGIERRLEADRVAERTRE